MKQKITLLALMAILYSPFVQASDVMLVNDCGEDISIHILRYSGNIEEISSGRTIEFKDSCTVVTNHFNTPMAYYVVFDSGTDLQFHGSNSETWRRKPNMSSRPWVNSRPSTGHGSVKFIPIEFPNELSDTTIVIRIESVSDCFGDCVNGYGSLETVFDSYEGTWKNALPHGRGVWTSGDTVFKSNSWFKGQLSGNVEVSTSDGYFERTTFKNGTRDGASYTKLSDGKTWLRLKFRAGKLDGRQTSAVVHNNRIIRINQPYRRGRLKRKKRSVSHRDNSYIDG